VPWCDTCDRFLSPSTVRVDGTCPACGRSVDPGRAHVPSDEPAATTSAGPAETEDDDEKLPLPWHLKLLAGALAVYLGYRFLQGIEWIFGK
jgi:hypothetical protein